MYNRIALLCDKKQTNVTALCKEVGISRSLFTELKSGRTKTISFEKAKKIADYFGVTVDYLITGEEKEKTPPVGEILTEGEQMLVELFRSASEDKQELILNMIKLALTK